MATVADQAMATVDRAQLPTGDDDRFAGYGIMGLPFASGHVLAMRKFPAASIGRAYTSIWHRDPAGRWEIWQDQPIEMGCGRYFSTGVADMREVEIDLSWTQPGTICLTVPELAFEWSATMRASRVTRLLNGVGAILPDRLWKAKPVLSTMGPIAGVALRAGRVALSGAAPNGQHFIANPLKIWLVADSAATLDDVGFGPIGSLDEQAALGDFQIPQRGVFAIGRAYYADK